MRAHLVGGQCDGFAAKALPDHVGSAGNRISALVDGKTRLKVGQIKGVHAVAAVGGAEQVEERIVLRDGEALTIAKRPTPRGEIAAEHADFTDKRSTHKMEGKAVTKKEAGLAAAGVDALKGNAKVQRQRWLAVFVRLAAAAAGNHARVHGRQAGGGGRISGAGEPARQHAGTRSIARKPRGAVRGMGERGHLRDGERHRTGPAHLAKRVAGPVIRARTDGYPALEVGQGEGIDPVASVSSAEQ